MWTLKTKDIPALHGLTTWIFVRNSVSLSFPVRFPALIHNITSHRQAVNQFKWKVLKENAYTAHFKTLCGGNRSCVPVTLTVWWFQHMNALKFRHRVQKASAIVTQNSTRQSIMTHTGVIICDAISWGCTVCNNAVHWLVALDHVTWSNFRIAANRLDKRSK